MRQRFFYRHRQSKTGYHCDDTTLKLHFYESDDYHVFPKQESTFSLSVYFCFRLLVQPLDHCMTLSPGFGGVY